MSRLALVSTLLVAACAHTRTPEQQALLRRGDCAELLRAADAARADGEPALAAELASACPQAGLDALVADEKSPPLALLWCGRARAAVGRQLCSAEKVFALIQDLRPHLTLGPADPDAKPDELMLAALRQVGPELNLSWDQQDPHVYVGSAVVHLERAESETVATVAAADGSKRTVPATLHRLVARAETQVELGAKTRTVRAREEARDATWDADPSLAVPAKFAPAIASEQELSRKAVISLVRTIAKRLAGSPPESVDGTDAAGCMAYGLAVATNTGDRDATAHGVGDPEKIAGCEKILGMPTGAGIPVP